jgi:glutaredoxin
MEITLYELEDCPYCIAVAEALQEAGIQYETEWVDGPHSARDEVKRVSGQREVPVLVDEARGVTMAESENIIEYVEETLA